MNNSVTTIDSFEIRDLGIEIVRCEFDHNSSSYFVEITLWPEDLLSDEQSQHLVLNLKNAMRLETALQQALQTITRDRAKQEA